MRFWLLLGLVACNGADQDDDDDGKPDADADTDTDTDTDADSDTDSDSDTDTDADTDTGAPCFGSVTGFVRRLPSIDCTGGTCVGDLIIALVDEDVFVNPDAYRVQEITMPGANLTLPTGVEYEIDPAVCGVWWVAAFLDVDGDGEPGSGDLVVQDGGALTSIFDAEPSPVDLILIRI